MATIKEGYASRPTHIRVHARDSERICGTETRMAELWITQEGSVEWLIGSTLKPAVKGKKYKEFAVVQDQEGNRFVQGQAITEYTGRETLAYITLDELLTLRDEINSVIQELVK